MKKIYLAGPDVFRPNALEFFDSLKEVVKSYGYIPLPPLDNSIDFKEGEFHTQQGADKIFKANIDLINKADVIIANLISFRGVCIDDGTAFEIGYGFAMGKVIYGYTEDYLIPLNEKTEKYFVNNPSGNFSVVENFGYCSNLMICSSIKSSGGKILKNIEECLDDLIIQNK